jgi:hypothetical protein
MDEGGSYTVIKNSSALILIIEKKITSYIVDFSKNPEEWLAASIS